VGDARSGERHVADLLRRRFRVEDPIVLLLARLTIRATAAGHSCLDLELLDADLVASLDARRQARDVAPAADLGQGPEHGGADGPEGEGLPSLAAALEALRACPAVHVVGGDAAGPFASDDLGLGDIRIVGPRPLVLDGTRLATHREHRAEQRLLSAFARRAASAAVPVLLAPTPLTGDPDQVAAVATLGDRGVRAGIGVLAGGPGTGKTTTVAALLAARVAAHLGEQAVGRADDRPLSIALAAPTGKAAARLTEALRGALGAVAVAHGEAVARQLAMLEATTVHRLLGIGRGGSRRSAEPLPHDLVVVDEASMLALPLAATLLDALEDRTQLVLVGDPDQLESVETGSVLRALVDTLASDGGPLARLTRNHRLDLGEGDVLADVLARAVRDGDVEATVALLRGTIDGPDDASVRFVATDDPQRHADAVTGPLLDDGDGGGLLAALSAAEAGDGMAALAALDGVRLLCAHRHGPVGASTWAVRLRALLMARAGAGSLPPGEVWLPGEPVMVLANDERTGLVNGDTGVVIGRGGARRLVFARRDGTLLERSATALPDLASAYAVTVHKSQGSEYGTVVVLLPPATSPLATRELLYTAITRARRRVVLVGSEASVRAAVARPSVRMSGLPEGLAALHDTMKGHDDGGAPLTSPTSG
jgi:exodeoxyribonuclease V alpha subunit